VLVGDVDEQRERRGRRELGTRHLQFGEDAVEGGTGTAGDGEG
jgi:hypothetical protein